MQFNKRIESGTFEEYELKPRELITFYERIYYVTYYWNAVKSAKIIQ